MNIALISVVALATWKVAVMNIGAMEHLSIIENLHSVDNRRRKLMPKCVFQDSAGMSKSFLIVFMSRSGSTAISTELQQHSSVYMPRMEYLDRLHIYPDDGDLILNATRTLFDDAAKQQQTGGFKIRARHVIAQEKLWFEITRKYKTRIIWQYRKNILKSAVGTYQREVLGDSTAIGGIQILESKKTERCDMGIGCTFRIDQFDELYKIILRRLTTEREIMDAVNILDNGRDCVLEVPYEDYLYNSRETMADIHRFLNIRLESHEAKRVKATSDNLCNVIENWDELCYHFYGCVLWQPYFDDYANDCRCTNFSHGPTKYCRVDMENVIGWYNSQLWLPTPVSTFGPYNTDLQRRTLMAWLRHNQRVRLI